MVTTLEKMQVPKGTGPGVQRRKRPLLASLTRCKCPLETFLLKHFTKLVKINLRGSKAKKKPR